MIIQAYKDYQYPESDKVTSAPDRDRSPLTTLRFVQESKSETSIDDVLEPTSIQGKHTLNFFNQTSDIDTSNDSFFPSDIRQPDFTSLPDHSATLATLSNAKPILPIYQSISIIEPTVEANTATIQVNVESPPPKILTEQLRVKCIQELSKPNTFLSDTTINAFCVSDYRALYYNLNISTYLLIIRTF